MPTAIITTNASGERFSPNFLTDTVKMLCDLLNKPFKGVAVILCNNVNMHTGELANHVIDVSIISVGDFADDRQNDHYVSVVIDHMVKETGIPAELISVGLSDISPAQVGFAGGQLALDKIRARKQLCPTSTEGSN